MLRNGCSETHLQRHANLEMSFDPFSVSADMHKRALVPHSLEFKDLLFHESIKALSQEQRAFQSLRETTLAAFNLAGDGSLFDEILGVAATMKQMDRWLLNECGADIARTIESATRDFRALDTGVMHALFTDPLTG